MIKNFLYLIFGFLFSLYIFYIRVLLVRLPKDLHLFYPTKYFLFLIAIIWITLSIFIIYKSIKYLLEIPSKETYFQQILFKVQTFIDDSLIQVYRFLFNLLPKDIDMYKNASKVTQTFYKIFGKFHEGLLFFISYTCRFLIVFCFFIDVFIFFELRYFYKALFLLCITIIINIFVYFLKDFATNLEEIEPLLLIEPVDTKNCHSFEAMYTFQPSPGNEDIDLKDTIEEYAICSKISGYLEVYDFCVNHYSPYFNICIYGTYLIGWLYVIIYNILYLF